MAQTKSKSSSDGRADGPGNTNRMVLLGSLLTVVVALAVLAFVVSGGDDDSAAVDSGNAGETGAEPAADGAQTASVELSGEALERLPEDVRIGDSSNDPEFGTVAPTLIGTDFTGAEVRIEADGRAKAIYFVAHWCPHCQEEIPLVQQLIDDGGLPEGLDVYAVSTAVNSGRGNYPPADWFESESFTPVVLRDDADSSAIAAFGGASFPYGVYLDADHQVVARSAGSLNAEVTGELWALAAAGGS